LVLLTVLTSCGFHPSGEADVLKAISNAFGLPPAQTPEQRQVTLIDRSEFVGTIIGKVLIPSTSLWQNGSVLRADRSTWDSFYIYAHRPMDNAPANLEGLTREWYDYMATPPSATGHPSIVTFVDTESLNETSVYYRYYLSPRDIGAITITAISGGQALAGTVHFTSLSGQTGTLNLRTGEWIFDTP
jgi:hypothetical protein